MGSNVSNLTDRFSYDDGTYYVTFDRKHFAEGSSRIAYLGCMHAVGQGRHDFDKVVVKVFKDKVAKRDNWSPDMTVSRRAGALAKRFNEQEGFNKVITFEAPKVVKISKLGGVLYLGMCRRSHKSCHYKKNEWVIMEQFIPGRYEKFNSNGGWADTDAGILAQIFSHWTFHHTNGTMMVTDIQGVRRGDGYYLTDPAIHSFDLDGNQRGGKYGNTDLGLEGMLLFFRTHKCTEFCKNWKKLSGPSFTQPGGRGSSYDWDTVKLRDYNMKHARRLRLNHSTLGVLEEDPIDGSCCF